MIKKAPPGRLYKGHPRRDAQARIIAIITPAPELAYQASERGVPMVTMQPESLVARQFRNVAEYLMNA